MAPSRQGRPTGSINQRALALLRINPDIFISHEWGMTHRSLNGPLHVVKDGTTWCGGGVAYEGERNVGGRRCPRCMALVREEYREYALPDLTSDDLWEQERFYRSELGIDDGVSDGGSV